MPQATSPQIRNSLKSEDLRTLCSLSGPWITVFLPGYHPGAGNAAETVPLKNLLRTAPELPALKKSGTQGELLLEPLREFAQNEELEAGGDGLALFSAPSFFSVYRIDWTGDSKLAVGSHPLIRYLLGGIFAAQEIFALGLSRKHTRLFRYRNGAAEELELPADVSASMMEAMDTEKPDHDLANRSASGSTGSPFAVRFGTGSDRETAPEYLHHYFTLLDRSLHPLVKTAPVFLMGVAEEIAAFRKAAKNLKLMNAEANGSAEHDTLEEVGRKAREAARVEYRQGGLAVLRQFREMTDRVRTSSMLSQIVTAAEQGRVHQALLTEEAEIPSAHRKQLMDGEEVLNAIAVETIQKGGEVFILPADQMADLAPVAAILRY